jgi:quercetin dioxygenase-like cupin family protein
MNAATTAEHTVLIDREEIRVTEWRLAPGVATGHHRHEYDYLVVPLTEGVLRAIAAAGQTETPLHPGRPYFRKSGVEHDVSNAGAAPLAFLEIELKDRPG